MNENVKIAERLEAILCDPDGNVCCHGSDGDRQELQSIIQALRSPSPPQGTYSIEDINNWASQFPVGKPLDVFHPVYGIAAWKAKQPPSTNDVPTELAWR